MLFCDAFALLSFRIICQGGYKVLIDGREFAVYESGALCSINIADIDSAGTLTSYPAAYTLHTAVIIPQESAQQIVSFKCERSGQSGTEEQGILWLDCAVDTLMNAFSVSDEADSNKVRNNLLKAVTAQSGELKLKTVYAAFNNCLELEYLPPINFQGNSSRNYCSFRNCKKVKKIILRDFKPIDMIHMFYRNSELEIINWENTDFSLLTNATEGIVETEQLNMPMLDLSKAKDLTKLDCYGSKNAPLNELKGLLVSSAASFSGYAPQINIAYTGLNRAALITLFESLPIVSGGQKINISSAEGAAELTEEDLNIAITKGWEVMQ